METVGGSQNFQETIASIGNQINIFKNKDKSSDAVNLGVEFIKYIQEMPQENFKRMADYVVKECGRTEEGQATTELLHNIIDFVNNSHLIDDKSTSKKDVINNRLLILSEISQKPATVDGKISIESPLQFAIQKKDIQLFDRLLKEGVIPNDPELLTSAMNFAVTFKNIEALNILLENKNSDPNLFDKNNNNPLFLAAKEGDTDMVKLLFSNSKVDPNVRESKNQRTALFYANLGVMKLFLENDRVDKNLKDINGDSALTVAAKLNETSKVDHLLPFYVSRSPAYLPIKDSSWFTMKTLGFISAAKQMKDLGGKEPIDWSKKIVKLLSHEFSFKGSIDLEVESERTVPYSVEGAKPQIWLNIMAKSIEKSQGFSTQSKQKLSNMLRLASDREKETPANYLESLRKGNPILLPTGYPGHSTEIMVTPSKGNQPARLFICDRGGGVTNNRIQAFTIDDSMLDEELISLIQKLPLGNKETYLNVIDLLTSSLNARKDPLSNQMERVFNLLPLQTAGNCTWVSAETAILAATVLMEVESGGYSDQKAKKAIGQFEQWYQEIRTNTLERYLIGAILNKKGILNHTIALNSFREIWKLNVTDNALLEHIEVMESLYRKTLNPKQLKLFNTEKSAFEELVNAQTLGSTQMYQFLRS